MRRSSHDIHCFIRVFFNCRNFPKIKNWFMVKKDDVKVNV